MKHLISALVIISSLQLLSCTEVSEIGEDGLPLKYSYTLTMSCFCTSSYIGPHQISMEEGVIKDYSFLGEGKPLEKEEYENFSMTKLQEDALEIIANGPVSQMVERHPEFNFISKAYFDIDERIADEEWGFTITDFKRE